MGPFPLRILLIEISPVQISHFSSANLTFLQCKSDFSPVQNPAFLIPRVYPMRMLMNFILSKWLELVLEFLHAIEVLAWVVSRYGVVHMQADTSRFEDNSAVAVIKSSAV